MTRSGLRPLVLLASVAFLLVSCFSASLLPDGRVLLMSPGGAQIYDPVSGTLSDGMPFAQEDVRLFNSWTPLPDGRVLVAGGGVAADDGTDDGGFDPSLNMVPVTSTAIYDATTATFTPTGSLNVARSLHSATLLLDGKVLVAGGGEANMSGGSASPPLTSAEVWDQGTSEWTLTGDMTEGRSFATATLLQNGQVLIVGGTASLVGTAELYDPGAGTFATTGSMQAPRALHTATRLQNGQVLIAGGGTGQPSASGESQSTPALTAELYDQGAGTFSPTGDLATSRMFHSAVLLADGKVALIGGSDVTNTSTGVPTIEVYDPGAGTFSVGGETPEAFALNVSVLLSDGTVLVAGGTSSISGGTSGAPMSFEIGIWDPVTGEFTQITEPVNA